MEACRALGQAMTEERKIRGEPADPETKSVEAIIRREYERWMTHGEEETEEASAAAFSEDKA